MLESNKFFICIFQGEFLSLPPIITTGMWRLMLPGSAFMGHTVTAGPFTLELTETDSFLSWMVLRTRMFLLWRRMPGECVLKAVVPTGFDTILYEKQ